jgi:hypothetical protein
MAVSKLTASTGANDFNVALTGSVTVVTFSKEYPAGGYSIVSAAADTTLDVYSFNTDGTSAGYTGTKSFTATKGFTKMVFLGGQTGDLLSFSYKETFLTTETTTETTAGPSITSASTSALVGSASTTTITGANFASGITAVFTTASSTSTFTASVVRNSASSLTITRGNSGTMIPSLAPYTLVLTNPGITNPSGSSANQLAGFTVGTVPTWSTATSLPNYTRSVAYSQTLVATDTEGSTMSYALQSGTLPTGLSLNTSTGVISGTPSVLTNHTPTIRVTDSGGNYVDRAFTLNNVGANAPVWSTAAGALANASTGTAYSVQLSVSDDSGSFPTLSLSGALPTGLSLNTSTGLISGTPTAGNGNVSFTITATDANGSSTARAFTIATQINAYYTSSASLTLAGSASVTYAIGGGGGGGGGFTNNVGCGGGGAGGGLSGTTSVAAGTYAIVVGAGGAGNTSTGANGAPGAGSSAFGITGNGGGYGATNTTAGGDGGCGGGGCRGAGGSGNQGGNGGGSSGDQYVGSGGGGMGGNGTSSATAGAGWSRMGYNLSGGGTGGRSGQSQVSGAGSGGGESGGNGTAGTGGGGGGSFNQSSGTGGSGYVILSYLG